MVEKVLILFCSFVGLVGSADGATIKRITKTKKTIELVADSDEILELRPNASLTLQIDETEATAVVKKVLPGNKVLIETTGGDLSLLKKGAVVTVVIAEKTGEVADSAGESSGTVMKVNKKKLQILTQVDAEWAIELAKLEIGAEVFVAFEGIKEPVPLYFEKLNKTSVVFGFDSKNIAQMTKATTFTSISNTEEQGGTVAGVTALPWFTFAGSPGLWMQKGHFVDAGYRYLDLKMNTEVDGNTSENTYKLNGSYVGGRFAFDIYRVGLGIEQLTYNDGYKFVVLNSTLNLGVHTSVIDFGVDISNIATKNSDDDYSSKSTTLHTTVNLGYSNNWFGLFARYRPRATEKVEISIENDETGEVEKNDRKATNSSFADAGFWVRATSKVMLKMQVSNDFNDGAFDDKKDDKILANERLGYNVGATTVGDVMQFSAGMSRNQSGLPEGDLLYSRTTPMTGLYLGTATTFDKFAAGINCQWQRGAIARKNTEYDVDVIEKGTAKIFSLNLGMSL